MFHSYLIFQFARKYILEFDRGAFAVVSLDENFGTQLSLRCARVGSYATVRRCHALRWILC